MNPPLRPELSDGTGVTETAEAAEAAEAAEGTGETEETEARETAAPSETAGEADSAEAAEKAGAGDPLRPLRLLADAAEIIGFATVFLTFLFSFAARLTVVEGSSMNPTLTDGDRLVAVALPFADPEPGDIVIVHRIDAAPYSRPIVKRVVAASGQTVDIDFDTWTLTVDGEVVEEPYRWLDPARETLRCDYPLPLTLGEHEIFVMGDNRNGSADSRRSELGPVDTRTVVGRAVIGVTRSGISVFRNPFGSD